MNSWCNLTPISATLLIYPKQQLAGIITHENPRQVSLVMTISLLPCCNCYPELVYYWFTGRRWLWVALVGGVGTVGYYTSRKSSRDNDEVKLAKNWEVSQILLE